MRRSFVILPMLAMLGGCREIDRFDTADGEAYCGSIVTAGFVREGFPIDLRLRLRLDTDRLDTVPGTIATDDTAGECTPKPLFEEAELRVTSDVMSDPLSTLEFGTGRELNLIAWVRPSCQQPMFAVVSLMKNDDVELRLLRAPAAPTATEPDPAAGFALFQLRRQNGTCGF